MEKKTNVQTGKVLTLVLFAVLTVCMVLVLFTGAGVYQRLTTRGQKAYEERTVPLYIATKVRQADSAGAVETERSAGVDVLVLKEWIDGTCYLTRIYGYEGYVREWFAAEDVVFEPMEGEPVAKAEEVRFALENGCLYVTTTGADGTVKEQMLTLRSVGEEAGDEE